MAVTISHTFATAALANRAGDAIAANNGYQAIIPDGLGGTMPNPQTKLQFCKAWMDNIILQQVVIYEGNQAAATAKAASDANVLAQLIIT